MNLEINGVSFNPGDFLPDEPGGDDQENTSAEPEPSGDKPSTDTDKPTSDDRSKIGINGAISYGWPL